MPTAERPAPPALRTTSGVRYKDVRLTDGRDADERA